MLEPLQVQTILRNYGLKPQKGLGQNFLVDDGYLQKIVEASRVNREDTVLEIGAGLGSLTRYLASAAASVIAVEIDGRLFPALKNVLSSFSNVRLIQGDIMEITPADLGLKEGYKVVANIPYYLTSNLMRRLMEAKVKPSLVALTMQKEVAQRICAEAGDLSQMALSVQVYGRPHIAFYIPKGAFYPVPRVDSAALLVELYPQPLIPQPRLETFFLLMQAGFSQKRKMLHNALAGGLDLNRQEIMALLAESGIKPERRAQTLSIREWDALAKCYGEMRSKK